MRLLFLGDIVGRPGRRAVGRVLPELVRRERVDFVVANCENASGGKGIDPDGAEELFDHGIDVLTSGNHVWQHASIVPYIQDNQRLLRPANFAPGVPGVGACVRQARASGVRVGVLNLIGRVFMGPAECPFQVASRAVESLRAQAAVILVDMHAEATSEKQGMGRFLDGRVSAVVGSHTHVQTADETVFPAGTAYITDAGMCGPSDSVLGVRTELVLRRFLTQMPVRFDVASGPVGVHGVVIDVDEASGHARSIGRIHEHVEP